MVNKRLKRKPKRECQEIGICAGCFTLLTPNHVRYLEEARSRCDYLIVLTNFDDYIKSKKGVVPLSCEDRVAILSALRCVSEVAAFEGDNEAEWIRRFKNVRIDEFAPNAKITLFHDQDAILGRSPVDVVGFGIADCIKMISRKPGTSVSDIFKRIRDEE